MKRSDIRGGIDTSVLVRLLTGDPELLSKQAFSYLAETQSQGRHLLVSDLVISEAYFACQHHYKMPKNALLAGLHKMLAEPIFVLDAGVLNLLSQPGPASAKPGFVDRLIYADYASQGARLVTFEKSAANLLDVDVLA
jgi:predicted nucleic-acid-binding protein